MRNGQENLKYQAWTTNIKCHETGYVIFSLPIQWRHVEGHEWVKNESSLVHVLLHQFRMVHLQTMMITYIWTIFIKGFQSFQTPYRYVHFISIKNKNFNLARISCLSGYNLIGHEDYWIEVKHITIIITIWTHFPPKIEKNDMINQTNPVKNPTKYILGQAKLILKEADFKYSIRNSNLH